MPDEAAIIRPADLDQIIDLRWKILRAGLNRNTAFFEGDHETTTRHFAAWQDQSLVGCVTIVHRAWMNRLAWQLRGMAVAADRQHRGIGRLMLDAVEQAVGNDDFSRQLWCNARTSAVSFYQKHGWRTVGEQFLIPTAGAHYKMEKRLK